MNRYSGARSQVLVFACVSVLVVVGSAGASSHAVQGFSGNVCALLSATKVAAIVGDTNAGTYGCKPAKTLTTPAGTTYNASAGSGTPSGGGFLSVQMVKYASPSIEARVHAQYKKSLKPVAGIGDWAYSHFAMSPVAGGTADTGELVFGAKGYGVLFEVRARQKKTVNQPDLTALAKQIVAAL
jgi:hypothetical protein